MEPVILIGRSVHDLGWAIAESFPYASDPINPQVEEFANGEIFCKIERNVRGKDCFIIQSICDFKIGSVNDSLMELLIMADALKRASAKSITAVIPHLGYARQDRKGTPRSPITSKLVANLIETSGVGHVVTMDMHCLQAEGFFDIPVDNLSAMDAILPVLTEDIWENRFDTSVTHGTIIVSPDAGGMKRARDYGEKLNVDVAMIDKRRTGKNQSEVMNIVGDVGFKRCILIDDMIDTGGTIIKAANALRARKAKDVIVVCTHPVFSNKAHEKLIACSAISKIIYTNTLPSACPDHDKIKKVDVSLVFSEALSSIVTGRSIANN